MARVGRDAIAVLELVATPLAAYDPGFTGLPTFAAFVWIVVVSVLLFRRGRTPTPGRTRELD